MGTARADGSLTARHGPARHGSVQPGSARLGSVQPGSVQPGSARSSPARLGSAQPGPPALAARREAGPSRSGRRAGPALCGGPEVLPAFRRTPLRYRAAAAGYSRHLRPPFRRGRAGSPRAHPQLPARNGAALGSAGGQRCKERRAPLPGRLQRGRHRRGQGSSARAASLPPAPPSRERAVLGKGGRQHPGAGSAATS